ncbi:MAG: HNH endonuclease signature motif containing protein [Nitrososphaerota archaeon]
MYYTPSGQHRVRGVGRLHQEIWKDANGPIPEGHHIHHKDSNPLNNALENLECVAGSEHHEYHMSLLSEEEQAKRREWFHRIREKASNWHGSDAGRQWHAELGRLSWEGRGYTKHICQQCGLEFESRIESDRAKFCSNSCKSAYRRSQGKDLEQRICVVCGRPFSSNRFRGAVTCSRSCRVTLGHRRKRESA